jgi:hypothetical protein
LAEAEAASQKSGERWWKAEVYRLTKPELSGLGTDREMLAEQYFDLKCEVLSFDEIWQLGTICEGMPGCENASDLDGAARANVAPDGSRIGLRPFESPCRKGCHKKRILCTDAITCLTTLKL